MEWILDSGVGVDEVGFVFAEGDAVVALVGGEVHESFPVEIDLTVVDVVGVFVWIGLGQTLTVGGEVDDAVLLVDIDDATYIELTFGDLVDYLSCSAVVEIEVSITVAFAEPDDLLAIIDITTAETCPSDVFLFFLFDDRTYDSCLCV